MRLWVDTDVGTNADDAVALLAARAHPAVDLVGVSTVGAGAAWRADVARHLLGPDVLVPVVAGAAEAVEAVPPADPETLLAIGPLTNVAALAATGWRPPRLVVMGGLLEPVRHRGSLRRVESNFAADPAAAAVVVSGPRAVIVPLDATVATRLHPDGLAALLAAAPALGPAVEMWLAAQAAAGVPEEERGVHLHDPAALLVATGEPVATTAPMHLVVEAGGRLVEDFDGFPHEIVVAFDAAAVTARIVELVSRTPGR